MIPPRALPPAVSSPSVYHALFPSRTADPLWLAVVSGGLATLLGCSSVSLSYKGAERTPVADPSQVRYVDVLPESHELLGTFDIQCQEPKPFTTPPVLSEPQGPPEPTGNPGVDVALGWAWLLEKPAAPVSRPSPPPVACADQTLDRDLRAAAGKVGGTLVVGLTCDSFMAQSVAVSQCTAGVARPLPEIPAPAGAAIRAAFFPLSGAIQGEGSAPGAVEVVEQAPPNARLLGTAVAGCASGCTRETVVPRLREAAASGGARWLSELDCRAENGRFGCVGKVWAP